MSCLIKNGLVRLLHFIPAPFLLLLFREICLASLEKDNALREHPKLMLTRDIEPRSTSTSRIRCLILSRRDLDCIPSLIFQVQLRNRKNNLLKLIDKMQQYQFDQIDIDQPLEAHVRALTDEDSER